ncbi:MAG: BadM/Rrf2 family transcriptional regulator [Rhodococcus sp. (in: high G+C Gram-positive bacteria)]|nr:MAG: BadM/Rrf2 family transcriptional regulator [Rhodococcus sp. (in: high G+C Gram-positive bacteria)]
MTSPTAQRSDRFRVEADMLAPLAGSAAVFSIARSLAMFEVPCSAGVPDVVFLRIDQKSLRERAGRSPLTELIDVRVMLATSRGRGVARRWWTADEIASRLGVTAPHLRRTVLPRMVAGGHLESAERGEGWRASYRFRSLARRVVTVEAKLRDWRGGVAQASRHAAVADAAWLAIDAASASAAIDNPRWFSTYGVGLATVSRTRSVEALIAPSETRVREAERELLVERSLALYQAGRVSGDVPRVFGQYLLASTGDDPRLAGVSGR